jgi:4-hydroxy-3-methylbut-2-enyl diphosphate reductase
MSIIPALKHPPMPDSLNDSRNGRVNVRRKDVMELVTAEVARHYQSSIVEKIRQSGGRLTIGQTTLVLAEQFGFCYGVERAIDLAYASRRVFPDRRIFLIGEIIHNPDVNAHLAEMDIRTLPWKEIDASYDDLTEDDVVIVPAFGAPTHFMRKLADAHCSVVDTTCGDVMKVWKRVRSYAKDGITSIIHGKASHEETRATASRALGESGDGRYLIVLTLADTDFLCDFIRNGGDAETFLKRFEGAVSPGFDPKRDLLRVGLANQTTMLKSETEEIQRRVMRAVRDRDGLTENFQVFDTICGATQERQDALFQLLENPPDLLLVIGGYNSSNTSHLVEIAEKQIPTFFIRGASCLKSVAEIVHYDLHRGMETTSSLEGLIDPTKPLILGITAGASCPNNLIEETILKVLELRKISPNKLREHGLV